jgi:predicted nucleotidyltransferase component of viral defense system
MLDRDYHKTLLLQTLKEIYTDPSLGPILGFKGGTAAYFFYDLSRFSVDLDFDLLQANKEVEVFSKIRDILTKFGTIREKYNKKNTLFFMLSYIHEAQNIKVEISKRTFGSKYELKDYLGVPMMVMVKEDMFAHKLVAMVERGKIANRDIFDVWFFLNNRWQVNKEIVEKRTGMEFKDFIEKCINFIESINEKNILGGMGELLDEKMKKWVKIKLKEEILFLLKIRVENEK